MKLSFNSSNQEYSLVLKKSELRQLQTLVQKGHSQVEIKTTKDKSNYNLKILGETFCNLVDSYFSFQRKSYAVKNN